MGYTHRRGLTFKKAPSLSSVAASDSAVRHRPYPVLGASPQGACIQRGSPDSITPVRRPRFTQAPGAKAPRGFVAHAGASGCRVHSIPLARALRAKSESRTAGKLIDPRFEV
jgi:hypothetical protein